MRLYGAAIMTNVGNGLQIIKSIATTEQLINNITYIISRYEKWKCVTLNAEYTKALYYLHNAGEKVWVIYEDKNTGKQEPLIYNILSIRQLMNKHGFYWNTTLGSWMKR